MQCRRPAAAQHAPSSSRCHARHHAVSLLLPAQPCTPLAAAAAAPHCVTTTSSISRRSWQQCPGSSRSPSCVRRAGGSSDAAAAAAAPNQQAAAPDVNAWYLSASGSSQELLPAFVGPVAPYRLTGVGLALEACKTLQPGETLLVCRPLAVLRRSEEAAAGLAADGSSSGGWVLPLDEEIEGLADQLAAAAAAGDSSGSRLQAWLRHLDDGSLEHAQSAALPDLPALNSSSGSSSAAAAAPAAAAAVDSDRLLDVADLNARVLSEDELLTAQGLAGVDGEPSTLVGIWPEAGLMRHSCSPNVSVLLHKSCAVVTAARSIPKQGAITASVLGGEGLAPLPRRRALLGDLVGGECGCPRCRDESKQDPKLLQLVADIYEACVEQVAPELEAAVESDNAASLERLRDELAAFCEVVDAGFSKLGVKAHSQVWLQASLFKLYELTAIVAAACGEPDAALLELLAALAGEVAPGSPEHLFWAQQYRAELADEEDAAFDGGLYAADAKCYVAFKLRYGRGLRRDLYQQLLQQPAGGGGDEDE